MKRAFKLIGISLIMAVAIIGNSSYAANTAKVDCVPTDKLDDKGLPVGSVNAFTIAAITSGQAFLICTSDDVKQGQVVKAVFSSDDIKPSEGSSDKASKTASFNKTVTVGADASSDTPWIGNLSPTMPDSVKPMPGNFHADIYIDDELVQTVPFSLQ